MSFVSFWAFISFSFLDEKLFVQFLSKTQGIGILLGCWKFRNKRFLTLSSNFKRFQLIIAIVKANLTELKSEQFTFHKILRWSWDVILSISHKFNLFIQILIIIFLNHKNSCLFKESRTLYLFIQNNYNNLIKSLKFFPQFSILTRT